MDETTATLCPWCSAQIEANAAACPACGASLRGGDSEQIPGVTLVDPNASLSGDPAAGIAEDGDAFEPPSEAVRNEMRKMELEAEILNAGGAVMSASGDEAVPVGPPSAEALAAEEQGLLDAAGPAGETDLDEHAHAWQAAREGSENPNRA